MTKAAKLHAARLGGLESGFSSSRDHLALGLSHDGHDPDDHLVQQEMGVARQAVDLGDQPVRSCKSSLLPSQVLEAG